MQIAAEATILESLLGSARSVDSGLFRRSVVIGPKSAHLNKLVLQTASSGLRPAAISAPVEVPGGANASVMGRLERGADRRILRSGRLEYSAGSAGGADARVGRTKGWTTSLLALSCGNCKCGQAYSDMG